jgi:hypothetical protein
MLPVTAVSPARAALLGLLLALLHGSAAADPLLYSVSPRDRVLRIIDAADGSTVRTGPNITLAGRTLTGVTGLAAHPDTGALFALLRIQGRTFPDLATLHPKTGVATSIGNTSDKFAGLAFASDGTLYAVSGDGGVVAERLFTLSTVDASSTLILELGAGSDGETLTFNPDDGLLYHASGIGNPNNSSVGEILETIDPNSLAITNVPLSGFDYTELTALFYSAGDLFAADVGDPDVDMPRFFRITTGGSVTLIGNLNHVSKGFASAPPTPTIPALPAPVLGILAVALLLLTYRAARPRR